LNCWIRGSPADQISSIKISSTDTVSLLKKAIRNDNPVAFQDVDPETLVLYKVTLPDDDLENHLRNLSLDDKQKLNSRTKLSKLFPE
ncbi:hypothetical protein BT69DRAFT_1197540, partial [Atractiella rhizophila]